MVRAGTPDHTLDWDALLERVGRASYRFLFPALEMAERLAPGTVPGPVREALHAESPPLLRWVVGGLSPATAQRLTDLSLEERLMWVGSVRELAGRAVDMAWPASAGGSWSELARIYAERLWRVVRRRVTLGR